MSLIDVVLANRTRDARIGVVSALDLPNMTATVVLGGSEVMAYLTDHVLNTIAVGSQVTLRSIGETYEVTATHTGVTGSGGVILGAELLPNGGFEYGGAMADHWSVWPWVVGDYTYARDTTPGESVSGSARMLVGLNPGTDAPQVNVWSEAVRVDPGAQYQAAVWVKASALSASLVTDVYVIAGDSPDNTQPLSSGTSLTGASVTSPGSAYQLLPGTITIPAGLTYARVFLRAQQGATEAAVAVSWDEASLRQRITS